MPPRQINDFYFIYLKQIEKIKLVTRSANFQFFYAKPLEPSYGYLRLKNHYDKTVPFKPAFEFKVREWSRICLSLSLQEERSNIKLVWNGKKILDLTQAGEEAIKGEEQSKKIPTNFDIY